MVFGIQKSCIPEKDAETPSPNEDFQSLSSNQISETKERPFDLPDWRETKTDGEEQW